MNQGKKRKFSKEHRKKLSDAHMGKIPWNKERKIQTNTGRTHFKKGNIPWSKGKDLIRIDKKLLCKLYVKEKKSSNEVAKIFNTSSSLIKARLRRYGWIRSLSEALKGKTNWNKGLELIKVDKDSLYKLYVKEKKSSIKVAEIMDVSKDIILNRLTKYGWKRTRIEAIKLRRINIDKKFLDKYYSRLGYSICDIGKMLNCNPHTVLKRLQEFKMVRTSQERYQQKRRSEKLRKANLGKKASPEVRKKLSIVHKGLFAKEKHPNWKGGITPLNQQIRHSDEYKEWRKKVFRRDNWTCQICGKRGASLRANHIKRFIDFPELRTKMSNGITICSKCDCSLVLHHEQSWESYFNFNLETRGFLESDFIPSYLDERGNKL